MRCTVALLSFAVERTDSRCFAFGMCLTAFLVESTHRFFFAPFQLDHLHEPSVAYPSSRPIFAHGRCASVSQFSSFFSTTIFSLIRGPHSAHGGDIPLISMTSLMPCVEILVISRAAMLLSSGDVRLIIVPSTGSSMVISIAHGFSVGDVWPARRLYTFSHGLLCEFGSHQFNVDTSRRKRGIRAPSA